MKRWSGSLYNNNQNSFGLFFVSNTKYYVKFWQENLDSYKYVKRHSFLVGIFWPQRLNRWSKIRWRYYIYSWAIQQLTINQIYIYMHISKGYILPQNQNKDDQLFENWKPNSVFSKLIKIITNTETAMLSNLNWKLYCMFVSTGRLGTWVCSKMS